MFFRIITVVNFLFLVGFAGLYVMHDGNVGLGPESSFDIYALQEQVDEIEDKFDELYGEVVDPALDGDAVDPIDDTLKMTDGELQGYSDLRGYMVTEKGDVETAYFVVSKSSDDTLFDFIEEDDGYYLKIGCRKSSSIETPQYVINGYTYTTLRASTAQNQVDVRAFFTPGHGADSACSSYLNGLQLASDVNL